ncbi:MAG: hypothetical protein QG675_363 [Patescibacteria group bacterium]|jgi:hypothetical protein|nr:hypothetical protein [Patescibacteria group bacterium]
MFGIPSNMLPLAVMGTVALFFGLRGLYRYNKTKSPLTLYYSLSGILFGLSGLFYAIPFAITASEIILKSTVTIADILFYCGIMLQMRIIWYLGLKKRISFMWLFWPTFLISLISLAFDMNSRMNNRYYVENSIAIFPTNQVTLYLLALLSISIILVGLLTLMQIKNLKTTQQKIRLATLGLYFLFAGITVEYNFLFLGGNNTSSTIVIGYAVAALGFFVGLLFVTNKRSYIK